MRFGEIAALIFCIQVSLGIFNAAGIFHETVAPNSEWFDAVDNSALSDASYVQGQLTTTDTFGFGDFFKGLFYAVTALGYGIIAVPYLLAQFGVIAPFSYYFSLPIYMLYFLWIAEFIRGTKI